MKSFFIIPLFILTVATYAGPGHDHSHDHGHGNKQVSIKKIKDIAKKHVARLAKASKIDSSWNKASFIKSEKKKFGSKEEWVVSFKNDQGVKGKVLYIFLKQSGDYVAANFTGK
ncbi:hypothetical protein A9Q84_16665 [Halobacteriovorax marinus]|uniref:Uncharacterized protein n=1 Tax=Halobacteriovorax marinus TaxID=97084 RepID=A0A1Y5F4Y6_9BACT|nr:hypothetical protein A9Q84_16665 [Halobacteriovorax marinus]